MGRSICSFIWNKVHQFFGLRFLWTWNFFGFKICWTYNFFGPRILLNKIFLDKQVFLFRVENLFKHKILYGSKDFFEHNISLRLRDFHWRWGIKPFKAEHFLLKSCVSIYLTPWNVYPSFRWILIYGTSVYFFYVVNMFFSHNHYQSLLRQTLLREWIIFNVLE